MTRHATSLRALSSFTLFAVASGGAALGACSGDLASDPPPADLSYTAKKPVDAGPPAKDGGDGATDAAVAPSDMVKLDALLEALAGESDDGRRRALVAAFTEDVAYGAHGFPIREGGRMAVVYFDREGRGGPVAVAGDFNGWSVSASPMTQPVAGFGLYVRVGPDPAPAARSRYKLVRKGAEWLADPLARRFTVDDNGEISLLVAGDAASHRERWPGLRDRSGVLPARTVEVLVPAGYEASKGEKLPVLVMQDGQNVFAGEGAYGSWRVDGATDAAIAAGDVRRVLVVAVPHGPDRFAEYTHTQDSIPGFGTSGGLADAYGRYLVDEVVPLVRGRYRASSAKEDTALAGSSLGGLVSLYVALRHPTVFGNAASFSGTMSWGRIGLANPTVQTLYEAKPPKGLRIYLDSGGDDGGGCAALSALDSEEKHDQYCENVAMCDALVTLGWELGDDLLYVWAPFAGHNEAEWAKRFPDALRSWFPRR